MLYFTLNLKKNEDIMFNLIQYFIVIFLDHYSSFFHQSCCCYRKTEQPNKGLSERQKSPDQILSTLKPLLHALSVT